MEQLTPSGILISLILFFSLATSLPESGPTLSTWTNQQCLLPLHPPLLTPSGFFILILVITRWLFPLHLYTYNHVMDGFSAVLSQAHLDQLHEFESFSDDNFPPVPERWRGACESGTLIGARSCKISFSKDMKQERINTSTTAIGIAAKARIAMFEVLFFDTSYIAAATDVLAGMDRAIGDGVDVSSLSLGFYETLFDENPTAVGAFAALKKKVIVSRSAGNNGPHAYSILNGAPWITTVGAGTIDRNFAAHVMLGDGDLTVNWKICLWKTRLSLAFLYILDKEPNQRTLRFLLSGPVEVSGNWHSHIATLLKATHHDWSPAAIRSAMMTTADVIDNTNGRIIDMITGVPGTLDFGAEHINPNKALNRGPSPCLRR
ncbi:hypothetical protein CRYUN_Cryun06bG0051600 [Craigia yunnanensis]